MPRKLTDALTLVEQAAPATPAAGTVSLYAKADGLLYSKDPGGVETLMSSGAVSYATPAIALGSAAAAGAAATLIRSDATIAAFDATAPSIQAFGDAAAVGTAAFAARRDHKHGMPAAEVPSVAWTAYTPTFSNFTLGNGVLTAGYIKIGRLVEFAVKVVLGTTSAMSSSPALTLPVQAATRYSNSALDELGSVHLLKQGVSEHGGPVVWASNTTVNFYVWTASGSYIQAAVLGVLIPFTWAANDGFMLHGAYESAS